MSPNLLRISAVICTHNRAQLLDQALDSLAQQTLPRDAFEVIIVDNASVDNTRGVAEIWMQRSSNMRYVYEPILGLSQARNRGAAESKAQIIAYLDDDAKACVDWLDHLWQAFHGEYMPAVVGGCVKLAWEGGQAPSWMSRHIAHALGFLDCGEVAHPVVHANGCNMAVISADLRSYGGFKAYLGRKGGGLLSGEESDLMQWVRAHNKLILYEPRAAVEHFVPTRRQTIAYMLKAYYGMGWSEALRSGKGSTLYRLWHTVTELPLRMRRAIRNSLPIGASARFVIVACEMALAFGFIMGKIAVDVEK
jgi:glucosyl-dolichyl phosphate glucuronosyltransferase